MSPSNGNSCSRVSQLCEEAQENLGDEGLRRAVHKVGEQVNEPLRVAIAGRVKSGKSTLVNAILRHKVAPTAVGECTRAVTWFRAGYPPRAQLMFRDGGSRSLPLERGQRLPMSLGADASELDRVDVELSSDALERMTVIDTPGLESANDQYSAATRRTLALGSGIRKTGDEDASDLSRRTEEAAGKADALVFVLTGEARSDEVEVLESFRGHLGGLRASAVNTIVVLNKCDLLGEEGGDPLDQAQEFAGRYSDRLGALAAAVIPTVGVLAETLEAGLLTESHVATLRKLAALDPKERLRLLDNVDWFLETDVDVPRAERDELMALLGLYGVRRTLEWIDEGHTDVAALRAELAELTGIDRLRTFLDDLFGRRADVLKAANALAELERLREGANEDDAAWLGRAVEKTRLDPAMRALATTWVFAQVAAREIELPEELGEDLRRVALGGSLPEMLGAERPASPSELQAAANVASDRWRRYANDGVGVEQKRVADAMCQQYAALWQLASPPVGSAK